MVLSATTLLYGYVVAGVLVLVVSVALVVNADLHKKRGAGYSERSGAWRGKLNQPQQVATGGCSGSAIRYAVKRK